MIEQDTVKLLRECDAGARMGVSSIDDVVGHAQSEELGRVLKSSKKEHEKISGEIQTELHRFHDEGKSPSPVGERMAGMMAGMKLMMNETDHTIADLMTDGCNMGVKSLSRYLNQYAAADEKSKDIAKRLISLEEQLAKDMRQFL